MNWLFSFWDYFQRVLLPARWRQSAMEQRVSASLDRASRKAARPEESLQQVADKTGKKLESAAPKLAGQEEAAASAPAKRRSGFAVFLRWTLHFVLVGLILVGLWYLNRMLGVERLLRSSWPFLHPYWLPILFLLLYVIAWLGAWLWRLTGPDRVGWDYPDINQAWEEAVQSLHEAGIDVRQAPLFLVVGQPAGPEDQLFQGADLGFPVRHVPRTAGAPLHVYASHEAIFVTCPLVSVLGVQAALIAEQRPADGKRAVASAPGTVGEEGAAIDGDVPDVTTAAAPAVASEEATESAAPEAQRVLGLLAAEEEQERPRVEGRAVTFLKDQAEVRHRTRRLQHLCRLIARERRPFCPLNGVLVLVPFAASQDDDTASAVGTACRYDLMVVRDVLQVVCPAFVLVCDMDASPGFRELLRRLPAAPRVRRLGQRFPLLPDVDDEKLPRVAEDGVRWLCSSLVPALAYNLFCLDVAGNPRAEAVDGNSRLYRLLADLRERQTRLGHLLARALLLDLHVSYLLGGVYLAATGVDARPLLTGGVLARLVESQNYVSWTPEALAADRRYRGWSWLGWLGMLAVIVGVPVAVYLLWRNQ
jgi:hypothetical protein